MKLAQTIRTIPLVFLLAQAGCDDSSDGGGGPNGEGGSGGTAQDGGGGSPGGGGSSGDDDGSTGTTSGVQGYSQKGPFEPGGAALAQPLRSDGSPGDGEVTGSIEAQGEYQLGDIDWSGPTEIHMEGTFYNEVSGSFSEGNRTLTAVTEVSEGETPSVNVNIFTYFTAERTKTLMADGVGFADALDQARSEIKTMLDISANPSELDLLKTLEGLEEDSANLLTFSAASLQAGIGQAGLDELAADFADDGEFNGEGVDELSSIDAEADSALLSDARANLQSQYGTTPPTGDPSGFGWYLSPCAVAKLTEPRVFCAGETFEGTKGDDEEQPILFFPPADGYYAVSLVGDAATGITSGWRIHDGEDFTGTEMGSSDDSSPYEDTTDLDLDEGDPYAIRVFLSDSATAQDGFRLEAWPVSEGAGYYPVALTVGETHSARVGELFVNSTGSTGGPATSWYLFQSSGGQHRIRTQGYGADPGDGGLQIDVYEAATENQTAVNSLGDLTLVDSASPSGAESNEVTAELTAGMPHFVLITNQFTDSRRNNFRPEAGWVEFNLTVSELDSTQ